MATRWHPLRSCFLALAAAVGACGSPPASESGKLRVTVTILPHEWLVAQIGGDRVEVATLVAPGESAELYQPTDAQIAAVARSAAYFRTGMPLEEGPGFSAVRSLESLAIVDLREGIALREMAPHAHHEHDGHEGHEGHDDHAACAEGGKDPHIWLNPRLLKIQARSVALALARLDPPGRPAYEANLADLERRLDEADATIRQTLAPHRGRAFFVFHPAWGYFADEYGLRQVAIETEGKEPSDRELHELQRQARDERVETIFVQPQSGSRSAEAVARAIGGRVETLDDLAADPLTGLVDTARRLERSFR